MVGHKTGQTRWSASEGSEDGMSRGTGAEGGQSNQKHPHLFCFLGLRRFSDLNPINESRGQIPSRSPERPHTLRKGESPVVLRTIRQRAELTVMPGACSVVTDPPVGVGAHRARKYSWLKPNFQRILGGSVDPPNSLASSPQVCSCKSCTWKVV